MNIIEETKQVFQLTNVTLSERVKVFQIDFSQTKQNLPSFDLFVSYINLFPKRDAVRISFSNPDDKILNANGSTKKDEYDKYFGMGSFDDDISVKVYVDKAICNNILSIYNFSTFAMDISEQNFSSVLLVFSSLLQGQDKLLFEVLDEDVFFCTKTMAFMHDTKVIFNPKVNRKEKIDKCRDNTYCYPAQEYGIIPDDFYIITDYIGNYFTQLFAKISTLLALGYISNQSSINENQIIGQINGQRNASFDFDFEKISTNNELFKIYDWIYTEGNSTDKALLARNIISLHCKYASVIDTDDKTFSAISSNYQLYLKENANKYIEAKGKVSEYICNIVAKIGEDIGGLSSGLKNNLVAFFGFLLTVVLVNIVSEQPLSNIFTKEITVIIELIVLGSFLYFLICLFEIKCKKKHNTTAYHELKENYRDVFSSEELNNIFKSDELMISAKKSLNKGIWFYSVLWCIFLLIILISVEILSDNPIVYPLIKKLFRLLSKLF